MKKEILVKASAVLAAVVVFVVGLTLAGVNPVNGLGSSTVVETSTSTTFKNLEVKSSNPDFNPEVEEVVIQYNGDKVEDIIVDDVSLLNNEPTLGNIIMVKTHFYHNRNNFKVVSIRNISTLKFIGQIISSVERDGDYIYIKQLIFVNNDIQEEIFISNNLSEFMKVEGK
jgi:hypothetical protein